METKNTQTHTDRVIRALLAAAEALMMRRDFEELAAIVPVVDIANGIEARDSFGDAEGDARENILADLKIIEEDGPFEDGSPTGWGVMVMVDMADLGGDDPVYGDAWPNADEDAVLRMADAIRAKRDAAETAALIENLTEG